MFVCIHIIIFNLYGSFGDGEACEPLVAMTVVANAGIMVYKAWEFHGHGWIHLG
jgi:hypothetical protein